MQRFFLEYHQQANVSLFAQVEVFLAKNRTVALREHTNLRKYFAKQYISSLLEFLPIRKCISFSVINLQAFILKIQKKLLLHIEM